jgi:hypothetical protein
LNDLSIDDTLTLLTDIGMNEPQRRQFLLNDLLARQEVLSLPAESVAVVIEAAPEAAGDVPSLQQYLERLDLSVFFEEFIAEGYAHAARAHAQSCDGLTVICCLVGQVLLLV